MAADGHPAPEPASCHHHPGRAKGGGPAPWHAVGPGGARTREAGPRRRARRRRRGYRGGSLPASRKTFTSSSGSGKMMVEFFSAEISTRVWR